MSLDAEITAALTTVLANTWAVELQPEPTWPAIVFETDSVQEKGWVVGAYRTQHTVTVHIMARTRTELSAYIPQIRLAMQSVSGYMAEEDSGDAEYEKFPKVYGKFINFRIRTTN